MISPSVFIAPGAQIIGQVSIGPMSSIWFGSIVRADVDTITIGQGCNIQDRSVIHVSHGFPVVLEDYVSVGHGAIVPVSYTHLDVYKRQILMNLWISWWTKVRLTPGLSTMYLLV